MIASSELGRNRLAGQPAPTWTLMMVARRLRQGTRESLQSIETSTDDGPTLCYLRFVK